MLGKTVKRHEYLRTHESLGGPGVTVGIAGMQSDGAQQFAPIRDYLPGKVTTYNAIGRRFRPDHMVKQIVSDLDEYVKAEEPIRFVGASMGGMLTPFVVSELRRRHDRMDPELLQAVIVDAPSGLKSLVNGKARLLGIGAVKKTLRSLPECVPAPHFLPKDEDITVPDELITDPDNYRWHVRQSAKARLSGFALSLWADEINWMTRVGRNDSLRSACRSLEDVDTIYVACDKKNLQVKQHVALPAWGGWLPRLRPMWVEATHCGFHQDNPQFVELFREIFGE